MKRIIFSLIIVLSFSFILPVYALDTSLKVYDYGDKLSDIEEELLRDKVNTFINNYNMDMVLVTVNSHNKYSTEAYADDFYDYNGFGIGSTHDGVLLVVDNNFSKENIWMSTTGEGIRMYDDYRIDRILDVVFECSYYASLGIPSSNSNTYINSRGDLVYKKHFPWIGSLGTSLVSATIVLLILISKNKMVKKATNANNYAKQDSLNITNRSDRFVTTHTTSVRINTDSGGGRIGGSSTHHGSSGISHGGGGRSR